MRAAVIGELVGPSRLDPDHRIGMRLTVVADRLLVDLSCTGTTAGDGPGAFTAGFVWTPPFWRW